MHPHRLTYRLSPQQRRILSLQRNGDRYYGECSLLLEGTLDVEKLRSAFQRLVSMHDILRTGYQTSDGAAFPGQYAGSEEPDPPVLDIKWEDLAIDGRRI